MSKRQGEPHLDRNHHSKMLKTDGKARLRVLHTDQYKGPTPRYEQPREINSYSIDHIRHVWFDNRQLKYYYKPSLDIGLSVGYDTFIKRDDTIMEHIDTLLDALTNAKTKSDDDLLTKADIITWRGIIAKLLCTPYSRREPWELRATRYNGTIYMEERVTEQKKKHESEASDRQKLMSYWGYKFETLSTISTPPKQVKEQELEERLMASANTNEQYCVVVKTKLGNHSLIMGAEVDCCLDEKPSDSKRKLSNYVELKTSKVSESSKTEFTFNRYKLLKFWAQSFLVGVPKIICGFRDDDGNLKKITPYETLKIPSIVREKPNTWDPNVCLNFANQVLDFIKSVVVKDDPTVTYSIRFQEPFREIIIECTNHDDIFLTQRFIDQTVQNELGGLRVQ